jgi:1,2-phenylacetyl-CoA epoxidase catalytic subunit
MLLVGRNGILTMMNKNKNQREMKQTAVDFAFEKLANQGLLVTKDYKNLVAYREAKEMEKEQIIDTYDAGQLHFWPDEFLQRGEYYYNETFKTNEK